MIGSENSSEDGIGLSAWTVVHPDELILKPLEGDPDYWLKGLELHCNNS